jgi:hypothetical protein
MCACLGDFVVAMNGQDLALMQTGTSLSVNVDPGVYALDFRTPGYQGLRPREKKKVELRPEEITHIKLTGNCAAGFIPFTPYVGSEILSKDKFDSLISELGYVNEVDLKNNIDDEDE